MNAFAVQLALPSAQANCETSPGFPPVTPEWLGNPAASRWPREYYPRNVWDLQTFGDYLYIGSGNSSNYGPSPNAGPVPVFRYDGRRFERVFTVQDEQIELFRVLGDDLYIPGHDARQSWDFGNLHKFDGRAWRTFRAIPNAIHVYDLQRDGDKLIAIGSIGDNSQSPDAWISNSENGPWRSLTLE